MSIRAADKRAAVWAFGVVLYKMLTGTRSFVGDDVSKTLAHVSLASSDSLPWALQTFAANHSAQLDPWSRAITTAVAALNPW